jgi:hypothetical protein
MQPNSPRTMRLWRPTVARYVTSNPQQASLADHLF